ncbi:hypothetical protein D0T84_14830 [Dysgonomonas sp. 521]|uniref:OmpP1/FadL family transporter n=1 Tax=Dysgonomonas sp. 521 TaxID=2302932 RepID=UPI0013D1252D|nr:outer membrane protein transport protein [Dysgonomonas sp. 521]NDV96176.1 hypothetical protein [Dysgonomonas sp. 521]
MKKVSLLMLTAVFSFGMVHAQNEMDAYKFSKNDLTGTARSVAMGGAFGALGGDISGIAINPAGIGVYSRSEIVTTMNFQNTKSQAELNAGKLSESKFKFTFDNLAFVGVFPLNNDVAPFLNVGFSYNRLKSFDRTYSMMGNNTQSITGYMAGRATSNGYPSSDISLADNDPTSVWNSQDWLTTLGYNAFLINENSPGSYSAAIPNNVSNDLYVREKGAISSYDFNIGTTFENVFSIGATVTMTDINYRLYSQYTEYMPDGNGGLSDNRRFDLYNWNRTDGTGWQVKAGVIVKPVQELRIGLAYHSPTWYKMTDHFAADLDHDLSAVSGMPSDYKSGTVMSYDGGEDAVYDYKLRTPDKWTISMAGVIGRKAIISADYELTNYKNNMKLFDRNSNTLIPDPNEYIKNDFKMASVVRVGLEYRFTDKFSGRVGYSWMESPFQSSIKNSGEEVTTDPRPVTHYVFDKETNYFFTYGLGYQFIPERRGSDSDWSEGYFYTDIAFVMKSQKADLYSFTGAEKASLKTSSFQGLLTVGYRFSMGY